MMNLNNLDITAIQWQNLSSSSLNQSQFLSTLPKLNMNDINMDTNSQKHQYPQSSRLERMQY